MQWAVSALHEASHCRGESAGHLLFPVEKCPFHVQVVVPRLGKKRGPGAVFKKLDRIIPLPKTRFRVREWE
jgi:hypothetical protein